MQLPEWELEIEVEREQSLLFAPAPAGAALFHHRQFWMMYEFLARLMLAVSAPYVLFTGLTGTYGDVKMVGCRIHPETGKSLSRAVRKQCVIDGSISRMVEVSGWYPDNDSDSIHSGADLRYLDAAYTEMRLTSRD